MDRTMYKVIKDKELDKWDKIMQDLNFLIKITDQVKDRKMYKTVYR